jgi:flagellar biosynthetic protein FlhB
MSERTEAPTSKRLNEARQRGQVARSLELNTAAVLLVGVWLLSGPGTELARVFQARMVHALTHLPTGELTGAVGQSLIVEEAAQMLPPLALIVSSLLAAGVAVTLAQTGPLWLTKRPAWDWSRVNPLTGLKRLFSGHGLVEFAKATLKLAGVGWGAGSCLYENVPAVLLLSQMDLQSALAEWGGLAYGLGLRVGGAYLLLAAADYGYQRWHLMRSLRMSKEEIKEEFKSQEGDPFLRGRIRQQQRRIARQRMMSKVPKADVVITNPTHFAVALRYDREHMRAPQVVAKGAALVAQRIREVAREHNVPLVENPPLARSLYRAAEVDQEVPPDLYLAVAEVLAFVYRLKSQRLPNYQ